jgi:hypothetical protein
MTVPATVTGQQGFHRSPDTSVSYDSAKRADSTRSGLSPQTDFLLRTWSNIHYRRRNARQEVDLMDISLVLGADAGAFGTDSAEAQTVVPSTFLAPTDARPLPAMPFGNRYAGGNNSAGTPDRDSHFLLFALIGAVPVLTGLATHRLITRHRLGAQRQPTLSQERSVGIVRRVLVRVLVGFHRTLLRIIQPSLSELQPPAARPSTLVPQHADIFPPKHSDLLLYVIEDNVELRKFAGGSL